MKKNNLKLSKKPKYEPPFDIGPMDLQMVLIIIGGMFGTLIFFMYPEIFKNIALFVLGLIFVLPALPFILRK